MEDLLFYGFGMIFTNADIQIQFLFSLYAYKWNGIA